MASYELSPAECRRLLRTTNVGRVAFSVDALPAVVPVNYVVWRDRVVFSTGGFAEADDALTDAVIAFEVDHIDLEQRTGWSIEIVGLARELDHPSSLEEVRELGLVAPSTTRVLWLSTASLTGRQLAHVPI